MQTEAAARTARGRVDSETHREIEDFLYLEAELLDDRRFDDWLALFADDARYEMPSRVTRERSAPTDVADNAKIFDDTREHLAIRVQRLATEFAWAEDPPSRTRHHLSNVRAAPGEAPGEYHVRSNVLLYRNRGPSASYDLISAGREDVLRRTDEGLKIARRRIVLDQSTLASRNLSFFL